MTHKKINVIFVKLRFLCYFSFISASLVAGQPEIQTSKGTIRGLTVVIDENTGKSISKFIGIPYALPPLRERRFRKPEPAEPFTEVYEATADKAICPQVFTSQMSLANDIVKVDSENCLYLNIYVPEDADPSSPVPVLVWLDGENFQTGQGDAYDAHIISSLGEVIVVTLNYRVGVFGFLSTGGSDAPGNYGLWDQHLALRWVNENIGSFGGDNSRVTLAGWSSGATSAAYHAVSGRSRGLFQRVILQSGSLTSFGSLVSDPLAHAKFLAEKVKCISNRNVDVNVTDMMNCMRLEKPKLQLLYLSYKVGEGALGNQLLDEDWAPVIDGDFIQADPIKLLENTEHLTSAGFYELEVLTGFNSLDGYKLIDLANQLKSTYRNTEIPITLAGVSTEFYRDEILPGITELQLKQPRQDILTDTIDQVYTIRDSTSDPTTPGKISRQQMFDTYQDPAFMVPVLTLANAHTTSSKTQTKGNTYVYYFDYQPSYELISILGGMRYGQELPFVFGFSPVISSIYRANEPLNSEQILSRQIVKYWTNFAWSGNPNIGLSGDTELPVEWPEYERDDQKYLILSTNMSSERSIGQRLFSKRWEFWIEYLPKLNMAAKGLPLHCPEPEVKSVTVTTPRTVGDAIGGLVTKPTSAGKVEGQTIRQPDTRSGSSDANTNSSCLSGLSGKILNMDTDSAETTIIALAASSGAIGLIALVLSCMLCARRRKHETAAKYGHS